MASISLKNSLKAGNSVQEHRSLRTASRTNLSLTKLRFRRLACTALGCAAASSSGSTEPASTASSSPRRAQSDGVMVALIDLNRSKDVNDTLGHLGGDRVLWRLPNTSISASVAACAWRAGEVTNCTRSSTPCRSANAHDQSGSSASCGAPPEAKIKVVTCVPLPMLTRFSCRGQTSVRICELIRSTAPGAGAGAS